MGVFTWKREPIELFCSGGCGHELTLFRCSACKLPLCKKCFDAPTSLRRTGGEKSWRTSILPRRGNWGCCGNSRSELREGSRMHGRSIGCTHYGDGLP